MAAIEFYSDGKLRRINARPAESFAAPPKKAAKTEGAVMRAAAVSIVMQALQKQAARIGPLMQGVDEPSTLVAIPRSGDAAIVPTATLIVEGASKTELKRLKSQFGLQELDEGLEGKILLRASEPGENGVRQAAAAAKAAYERGHVKAAHPNFVRVMRQIRPSAAGGTPLWNHHNDGKPGLAGADVAAHAAWTITRGNAEVRVAVLDEGVDAEHPALKAAVVADRDFVDGNPTSMPDGDDAHGTACAGIIVSRDEKTPGLASACSLVAARIAKGEGADGWVFDDFETAEAIDWTWKTAESHVLSSSWGGGWPADAVTRAFERARMRGRRGKGCVIVNAAGNTDSPIDYPASMPEVLAVGASNPWDERKSPTSRDQESWWGSCFGRELDLVAPGVKIATTDIQGARGYGSCDFVTDFNGTSSATPHVAAAAALVLSVAPSLTEKRVREILIASADRLAKNGKWDKYVGWGRVNLFAALRMARRA